MTNDEPKQPTCPYCGDYLFDYPCKHYLFSRDIHFSTGLELIMNADYDDCQRYIDVLIDVVDNIQEYTIQNQQSSISMIKCKRLSCMFDVSTDKYLNLFEYFRSLFRSYKIPFKTTSFTDVGGPGFCSFINICWSNMPDIAFENMKHGLLADIISISALSQKAKDIANEFNSLLIEEQLQKERSKIEELHEIERKREESIKREKEIQQEIDLVINRPGWKLEFENQLSKSFFELNAIERKLFLKYIDGNGIHDAKYEDKSERYSHSIDLKLSFQLCCFIIEIQTSNPYGRKSKTLYEIIREIEKTILRSQ